jgi:hypothetical protein
VRALDVSVADLRVIWSWYEAGHWPCAMGGRRLLVYRDS